MLCISEDSLNRLLKGEDVIRKLETDVEFYKRELKKQENEFKKEKQQIIDILSK
jgi:hypothetical protein